MFELIFFYLKVLMNKEVITSDHRVQKYSFPNEEKCMESCLVIVLPEETMKKVSFLNIC